MKFAFFGYDMMVGAVKRLLIDGHDLTHVLSFAADAPQMRNHKLKALAQAQGASFTQDRVTSDHIDACIKDGVEVFISAGYPYKIPPIPETACGINLHPTLLPHGRGIMPMPYIIFENPEIAGMTIHKLSDKFDHGDILAQEKFDLTPRDDIETFMARLAIHAPRFLSDVMGDFETHWDAAKPQKGKGSHYTHPGDDMRFLDFAKPVAELMNLKRAFGKIGTLLKFGDQLFIVLDFSVWEEAHEYEPGQIVAEIAGETVMAAKDGFVVLKNAVAAGGNST